MQQGAGEAGKQKEPKQDLSVKIKVVLVTFFVLVCPTRSLDMCCHRALAGQRGPLAVPLRPWPSGFRYWLSHPASKPEHTGYLPSCSHGIFDYTIRSIKRCT